MSGPWGRSGTSLAEAPVALLIGLLVLQLALTSLARMRGVQSRLTSRAEFIGSMRVLRQTIRQEIRVGLRERDAVLGADSISLRAFRGTAIVCRRESPTDYLLSFRGYRTSDTSKDSVLVIGPDGQTEVAALLSSGQTPDQCDGGAGASARVWRLDRETRADAVVIRLFERGSYHLSGSALQYR